MQQHNGGSRLEATWRTGPVLGVMDFSKQIPSLYCQYLWKTNIPPLRILPLLVLPYSWDIAMNSNYKSGNNWCLWCMPHGMIVVSVESPCVRSAVVFGDWLEGCYLHRHADSGYMNVCHVFRKSILLIRLWVEETPPKSSWLEQVDWSCCWE